MPTPPSTTKVVNNKAQFDNAVSNTAIKTIKLGDNVTGDLTINRLANLDLNGKTVTGNVVINTTETGTINISAGNITENLTIDAENASIVNNATVSGTTTINNVAQNTFTNRGTLANVVINDADGTRFVNEGITGVIDIDTTGAVTLEGTFENVTVSQAATITIPQATTITSPVQVKANSTIISANAIQAVVASGSTITVKANADDAGTSVAGTGTEVDIKQAAEDAAKLNLTNHVAGALQYNYAHDTPAIGNYKALGELSASGTTVTANVASDSSAIQAIAAKQGIKDAAATAGRLDIDEYAGEVYVMNTFARYIGALNYKDDGNTVSKVTYKGTDYTWEQTATGTYLKGSNWRTAKGGTTLVSVVTADAATGGFNNVVLTLTDANGYSIDMNFTVVTQ